MTVVKVIDKGFDKFVRRVAALDGAGVKVGIQADAGKSDDGVTDLLDIAIYNELGTATIPDRPFMRDAAEKYEHDAQLVAGHVYDKVAEGRATPDAALRTLGEYYQGKQQEHIRSGPWEPNAPSTIAKKGSSQPLIDKGKMIQAIRYEVLK